MDSYSFLPTDFLNRMEQDLGPDFHAFLSSYEEDKITALRINPIKANENTPEDLREFIGEPVKWCGTGYYYDSAKKPGSHPYHQAGVYYIQDASAQLPVEMLSPEPGDFVLDLCAAPGGKSTQIAGKLMGQGLLVSNEPIPSRAKILSENIERLGIKNAIVTNEYPDKLAQKYYSCFDKIMVDAPCSGEGMFRKNHDACSEWSLESVEMCAGRQVEILEAAYEMLLPGGRLCYSTCTFAKAEDEQQIKNFLSKHEDLVLIEERRLWPHLDRGEGHYAALVEKKPNDALRQQLIEERPVFSYKAADKKKLNDYLIFEKEALELGGFDNLYLVNDLLYKLPDKCLDFKGIHVVRGGLFLGTFKKNRFEPSHALALALNKSEVKSTVNLNYEEAVRYLKGETLNKEVKDGWCLVLFNGYSIGWGKAVKGQIKNHYPKGLRIL